MWIWKASPGSLATQILVVWLGLRRDSTEATCGIPRRCKQQVSKCWRWAFNVPQDLVCCLVLNAFPSVTDKHLCCMQQLCTGRRRKRPNFIESYRKRPILGDIRLKEYKNNKAKLDALASLETAYETDVASNKNKIKNLWTVFRRERHLRSRGKYGSSSIKKTKWFACDVLLFLTDVVITRPG